MLRSPNGSVATLDRVGVRGVVVALSHVVRSPLEQRCLEGREPAQTPRRGSPPARRAGSRARPAARDLLNIAPRSSANSCGSSPGSIACCAVSLLAASLWLDRAFPASDRGPVLESALLRLAAICFSVAMRPPVSLTLLSRRRSTFRARGGLFRSGVRCQPLPAAARGFANNRSFRFPVTASPNIC